MGFPISLHIWNRAVHCPLYHASANSIHICLQQVHSCESNLWDLKKYRHEYPTFKGICSIVQNLPHRNTRPPTLTAHLFVKCRSGISDGGEDCCEGMCYEFVTTWISSMFLQHVNISVQVNTGSGSSVHFTVNISFEIFLSHVAGGQR